MLNYGVALTANVKTEWWQLYPVAKLEIDGIEIGEETIDSEELVTRLFPHVELPAGVHTLNVTMTNDYEIPGLGGDLYIEKVVLSE